MATARSHAGHVTPAAIMTSAADAPPPAALDLPAAVVSTEAGLEARPAATGVPIDPSPSSSAAPRRRPPRNAAAGAAASASAPVIPTASAPAIPDHL